MTVQELIERLKGQDPAAEVRLMNSKSYHRPSAESDICGLATSEELDRAFAHGFLPARKGSEEPGPILYIVEGEILGMGIGVAWRVAA